MLSSAQQNAPRPEVEDQLIQRLPSDWRLPARRYHVFANSDAERVKDSDDDLRFAAFLALAFERGAEEFVATHLDEELTVKRPTRYRIRLLESVAYGWNWTNNPLTVPLLEHEAADNPDPEVSLAAVKGLRALEARRSDAIVEQRLKHISGDYNNHKEEVDQLEEEDRKLRYMTDEIVLPEFLQKPPAVFQVPTKSKSIRVAMMGDFGTRGEEQRKVAEAMVEYHRKNPFDFGLTLGDNFYFPLTSPEDPGLKVAFEDRYGPMDIAFYPVFGNHDWGGETPAIEMMYSGKNRHWHFPSPYYTYTAGPVQFFAINTEYGTDGDQHVFSAAQLRWLQSELDKSAARWKVVYGHMPPYTSMWTDPTLMDEMMPVLKGRADVYISGHVHNLEQHKTEQGVNLFVIGASGREEGPVDASDPDTLFAKEAYGFGVLEADAHALTVRILDEGGNELHAATFHK